MRSAVRMSVGVILLASLVLMGSGVMASGLASASPASCYPPGSKSCMGKLTVIPLDVARGQKVAVSGNGFYGGATVSIAVCKVETVFATANPSGHLSLRIAIPPKTPFGPCKFTATGLGKNKQTLTLTATVIVKRGSSTSLTLSAVKVTYGNEQVEHLSVVVSSLSGGPKPTGTVTVSESTTRLCKITLSKAAGSCALSRKQLAVGTYRLIATYGGSSVFLGSVSARKTLTVVKS